MQRPSTPCSSAAGWATVSAAADPIRLPLHRSEQRLGDSYLPIGEVDANTTPFGCRSALSSTRTPASHRASGATTQSFVGLASLRGWAAAAHRPGQPYRRGGKRSHPARRIHPAAAGQTGGSCAWPIRRVAIQRRVAATFGDGADLFLRLPLPCLRQPVFPSLWRTIGCGRRGVCRKWHDAALPRPHLQRLAGAASAMPLFMRRGVLLYGLFPGV